MSLQSVITKQVIPSLSIVDLLDIQNQLQETLAERVRTILHDADNENLFELEINSMINYKSINLTPDSVKFVNNFPIQNFSTLYVENNLIALMRGDATLIFACENMPDIWVYNYMHLATQFQRI